MNRKLIYLLLLLEELPCTRKKKPDQFFVCSYSFFSGAKEGTNGRDRDFDDEKG